MQRIARLAIENINSETHLLFSHYDELRALLLRHLPPSVVSLFARPVLKADNYVEWYSDLEGQPQLLAQNSPQYEQVNRLINQRLQSIENLRQSLLAQGKISLEQAQLLTQLTAIARQDRQIYLVNNEPIIIGWHIKPEPVPVLVAPPAEPKSPFRWWWLLLLLLLLFAGGLGWWWFNRAPETTPQPFVEIAEEPKLEPKLQLDEIPIPDYKKPEPKKEEIKPPEPVKEEAKKEEVKKEEVKKEVKKEEPPKPKTIDTALQVGKKWYGKYYCSGRMAKMTIEVIKRTGNYVVALERWDYGPGEVGIVYLEGVLTDKIFNARETRWHTRPQKLGDWIFTSFQGTYDAKRNIFHGRVPEAGCTTFEMRESK